MGDDREARVVTEGSMVLVEMGPPGMSMHVSARVLTVPHNPTAPDPLPDDTVVWINVNVRGSHLPQMYRLHELGPLDADVAAYHGLCVSCLGFGYAPVGGEDLCGQCMGTGAPSMTAMRFESPGMIEVAATIDTEMVNAIQCDVCRMAGTPQ